MKLERSILLPSLAFSGSIASTAHAPATVYIYDPDTPSQPNNDQILLPANAARLIFAQRMGLSDFHSLQDVDDRIIPHINQYAAPQKQLFSDKTSKRPQALIIVEQEDVPFEDPDSFLSGLPSFQISNPPSSDSTAALLTDFVSQARSSDNGQGPTTNLLRHLSHEPESESQPLTSSDRYFIHRKSTASVGPLILGLRAQSSSITIACMPPSNSSNLASWGTYALPSDSYVHSSHAYAHLGSHTHSKRQGSELLSAEAEDNKPDEQISPEATSSTSSPSSSASSSGTASTSAPTSTQAPAGILPACFSSQSDCTKRTNSCTGHGSCALRYTNKDQEGGEANCWSCACQPTVDKNDMGQKKTMTWGGPACQKRDVSQGFWLLTGFTIAMVSAVAWGIGLLVSMGGEELPSVIGAGVSGTGARGK
ncbi:MAG: hypothetical protein M1820_008492 [Bogoriella megaspora]|nr:MAG: hypothetical protein M1820_008492 [Bogoriella megaspora]